MKLRLHFFYSIFFLFCYSGSASSSPDKVFATLEKSVFVVEAYGADGKLISQGSAITTGPEEVVTNCHVLEESAKVRLTQLGNVFPASLKAEDRARDLCLLTVKDLNSPAIQVRSSDKLRIGERVYAIGAPLGFELTFSEGLVSSLRKAEGGFLIQTTAPISPGSSGGGLFDAEGNLIGITSFQTTLGQNLNFAVPGEWLSQIIARHAATNEKREHIKDLNHQADGLENNKSWGKLEKLARSWTKRYPDHVGGWYWLGRANEKQGRKKEAASYYQKATDSEMHTTEDAVSLWASLIFLAQLQKDALDYLNAANSYAEAMIWLPVEAFSNSMWVCFLKSGAFARALEVYQEISRMHPGSELGWEGLGSTLLNLDKPQEAQKAFQKLLALNAKNVTGWKGLLTAKLIQRDREGFVEAGAKFERVLPSEAKKFFEETASKQ